VTKYQRFEDLPVWQVARELVNAVYDLTCKGEFSRDFALRDQIRRAAISIMSNIAEGFESASDTNFIRYLGYAKSSTAEVRSQLYIATDRKYMTQEEFGDALNLALSCGRQLTGLIQYLQANSKSRRISDEVIEYEISSET
jgi:four helix bundle protein